MTATFIIRVEDPDVVLPTLAEWLTAGKITSVYRSVEPPAIERVEFDDVNLTVDATPSRYELGGR